MNKISTVFSIFVSALLLTSCQNKAPEENQPSPQTTEKTTENSGSLSYPVTIRTGYSTAQDDPRGIALDSFKKDVEEQTNGDIIVEIHPSGELGSDTELIAGMIKGDVDMTVSSAGNYASYATRIGVSALPFLFQDFDSAWEFIDSPLMQEIGSDLESYNMHVLAYFDNGFRCVTTSEKAGAVEEVADMKGLNIRTPENQIVMETMSALSANPKSYPFAELKQALADGTFDAQENPIPVIYNNGLYEVQKYLSVTNHSYDAMPLTIRQDIWSELTPEYQQIIADSAKKAETQNRQLVKKQTDDFVKELEKKGMEVVYPDLQPFKEATSDVKNMFSTVYGQDLLDYLKENMSY